MQRITVRHLLQTLPKPQELSPIGATPEQLARLRSWALQVAALTALPELDMLARAHCDRIARGDACIPTYGDPQWAFLLTTGTIPYQEFCGVLVGCLEVITEEMVCERRLDQR